MPIRNGGDRFEKWNSKFDPEIVKTITERGKPTYAAHARVQFNELYETELSVKQVLNMHPIPVTLIPSYLCFGREMWKATKRHSGTLLSREARVKLNKWVNRQLDEALLTIISREVFDVIPADTLD
jgi:hypothetical protein